MALDGATSFWIKVALPNWESKKKWNRTREMVWRFGIPPRLRGQVWPLALGNSLMVTPELFAIFGQHATAARKRRTAELQSKHNATAHPSPSSAHSPSSQPTDSKTSVAESKEQTFAYIDMDLSRTFPSLAFFQEECPMHEQLRDVLDTYCFYRPDMGYVQGMSYLAGNLLLYMSPYSAFVCLAHLLNSPFFHTFLKLDQARMQQRYDLFDVLFKEHLPELHKHFASEGVEPGLYFMEWCMTLFCKRLKLDVVGRVWDCYLISGESFVYRCAVGILSCLSKELMGQPFERIIKILAASPQSLTDTELFSACTPVQFSNALRDRLEHIQRL